MKNLLNTEYSELPLLDLTPRRLTVIFSLRPLPINHMCVLLHPPSVSPHPTLQRSRRDTCNFDKEFTKMAVDLTPTDKLVIMNLDQDDFLGFSFTNSEYEAPAN